MKRNVFENRSFFLGFFILLFLFVITFIETPTMVGAESLLTTSSLINAYQKYVVPATTINIPAPNTANQNYIVPVVTPSLPAPAPSDISALTTAKASAQDLITANAIESETPGEHIVGSLATLTSANTAANATTSDTQTVVDGQVSTLNTAIAAYNAAVVPGP